MPVVASGFSDYLQRLWQSKQRPLNEFEREYLRKHPAPITPEHDLIEPVYKEYRQKIEEDD